MSQSNVMRFLKKRTQISLVQDKPVEEINEYENDSKLQVCEITSNFLLYIVTTISLKMESFFSNTTLFQIFYNN